MPSASLHPSVQFFSCLGLSSTNFLTNKYLLFFSVISKTNLKKKISEASEGRETEIKPSRGSKCSEIVFGCHRTLQNLAAGLAVLGAGPGKASVDHAFWKVGKVVRAPGGSRRAPGGRQGLVQPGSMQAGGPGGAQMREIRTGMPGDSVLWGE